LKNDEQRSKGAAKYLLTKGTAAAVSFVKSTKEALERQQNSENDRLGDG